MMRDSSELPRGLYGIVATRVGNGSTNLLRCESHCMSASIWLGGQDKEVMYLAHVQPGSIELLPTLPGKRNLAHQVNRKCQNVPLNNPDNLDCELQQQFVTDGFLKGDVIVENKRHINLATDPMLALLSQTWSWFIDDTFYYHLLADMEDDLVCYIKDTESQLLVVSLSKSDSRQITQYSAPVH